MPSALVPVPLVRLANEPGLLRGVRSATCCFIDLGDKIARLHETAGGGWLVHFLSDQQGVVEWLIHVAPDGGHQVVVTTAPIGCSWRLDPEELDPVPDQPLTLEDLAVLSVEVCADSLIEFLARCWLDNETWWTIEGGEAATTPDVVDYQRAWLQHDAGKA